MWWPPRRQAATNTWERVLREDLFTLSGTKVGKHVPGRSPTGALIGTCEGRVQGHHALVGRYSHGQADGCVSASSGQQPGGRPMETFL